MSSQRITIIGNTNLDIMVSGTADLPAPGTERIVPSIDIRLGGSAGNLAVRCAGLGQPTTLVSRVGHDTSASLLDAELSMPSLEPVLIRDPQLLSGITVAVEAEGRDRSFLSSLGAMAAMTAEDIPAQALAAHFVALAGYFLLPGLQGTALAGLFARAKEAGAMTVLDTGWPPEGWTPGVRREVLTVLAGVDIFLPNDDELHGITGLEDMQPAAQSLAQETNTLVVVKRGSLGAGLATPAGQWFEEKTVPADVVDSTGAGDGFNAAFLVSAARGASWPDALCIAVRYATRLVGSPARERSAIRLESAVAQG